MSLEHSPTRDNGHSVGDAPDPDYWHGLIDEHAAAKFLGLTERTIQKYRQVGGGPAFVRVSSRCIRYTRVNLKIWSDARLRSSTSDPGQE